MSHHAHGYRIYPDNKTDLTHEQWLKADKWINGLEFRKDWREAMALAERAAISCQYPFVVIEIPIGGTRERMQPYWIAGYKYGVKK